MEDLQKEIRDVTIPDSDPVFGANGPLCQIWKAASSKSTVIRTKL